MIRVIEYLAWHSVALVNLKQK